MSELVPVLTGDQETFTLNKVGTYTYYYKDRMFTTNIYDRSGLDYIAYEIKDRIMDEMDCPIMITGPRRYGKSMLAKMIGTRINKEFTTEHMWFKMADFNKALYESTLPKPDVGFFPVEIYDEAGVGFSSLQWWQAEQIEALKSFQILGMKQLVAMFVLPHRNDLNNRIRENLVVWWFHVHKRGFVQVMRGEPNMWEPEAHWKTEFYLQFPPEYDPGWDAYQVKKWAFIQDYLNKDKDGPLTKRDAEWKDATRLLSIADIKDGFRTQTDISRIINRSQSTVSDLVNEKIGECNNVA